MSLIYLTESKAFIKVAESDTHPKPSTTMVYI